MDEIVISFASSKVDRMFFIPEEMCNILHLIKLPIEIIQIWIPIIINSYFPNARGGRHPHTCCAAWGLDWEAESLHSQSPSSSQFLTDPGYINNSLTPL